MRYNRLKDIGLTEQQIKDNLLFTTDKIGETMKANIDPKQAKAWFGANPPDLTVIARSRAGAGGSGADYLYTFLRTFYRDDTKATGWNNLLFPNVGMPHALWQVAGRSPSRVRGSAEPRSDHPRVQELGTGCPGSDECAGIRPGHRRLGGLPAVDGRACPEHPRAYWRMGAHLPCCDHRFAWKLNAAFWKDVK